MTKVVIDANERKKLHGREIVFAVTIDGKEELSTPHFDTAYFFAFGYLKAVKLDFSDNTTITEKARKFALQPKPMKYKTFHSKKIEVNNYDNK